MAEAMERGGDRHDQAISIRMRGHIAQQQGNLTEAERHLTEALATFRDLAAEASLSAVLNDLGDVARERKKYDNAEMYYRQALVLAEKIGNQEYQSDCCNNLGLLALDSNCPSAARPWFERGLALSRMVGRQDSVATAQAGLAEVLEAEQHYTEALRYAEQALLVYERLRHQDLERTRQIVERLRAKAAG
jgi:tetratricopeptide (TPR) repeat protein